MSVYLRASLRVLLGASLTWVLAASCLSTACVSACDSAPSATRIDRTNGLRFEFYWSDASEGRAVRAKLDTDGTYFFAGGTDANYEDFSWSMLLNEAQIETIRKLVDASELCTVVGDAIGPGECAIEFTKRDRNGKCSVRGKGETAAIAAFRAYLVKLSLERFADTMEALPKGNAPKSAH